MFRFARHSLLAAFALMACMPVAALAQGFNLPQLQPGISQGPSVASTIDPTTGLYFGTNRMGFAGHLESGLKTGTASLPALTGCGTTPTLAAGSTDTAGTITLGTTATGCVITFGTAFVAAPACLVTWRATPLASQSYTTSTIALTLTQTSTTNNLVDYWCPARNGG